MSWTATTARTVAAISSSRRWRMDRAGNGISFERVEQVGSATDATIAHAEEPDKHPMSLGHTQRHIGLESDSNGGHTLETFGTNTTRIALIDLGRPSAATK